MPLSLHCGGKRWGDARARSKSGERKGPTVKADVKLANQISPGIISVRAAKHPAAKRETTTSHAYNGERSEFNSHSSRKKIQIIQTCQATSRGVQAIFLYLHYDKFIVSYFVEISRVEFTYIKWFIFIFNAQFSKTTLHSFGNKNIESVMWQGTLQDILYFMFQNIMMKFSKLFFNEKKLQCSATIICKTLKTFILKN